jgi:2-polyprenyl-3-methyl-5-hydroxy-6-metoxy-1,4-benzoquinol methylase
MKTLGEMHSDKERRHREQSFFDDEEYSEGAIPGNTIERYMSCRKPFLAPEYAFWAMGDVRHKRVLELGCGDGANAVLLAMKGADVVGMDVSPQAIRIAQERAQTHSVADRTQFFTLPLESYLAQTRDRFDIICGFAVLHHVLPVLGEVIDALKGLASERAIFVFSEPVSLSHWLRRLRLAMPIACHGTEDERPLEPADLAILHQRLPNVKIQLFGVFLRVWNRLIGGRYEDYSNFPTALFDSLAKLDHAILALPPFRCLASNAVISAGSADLIPKKLYV